MTRLIMEAAGRCLRGKGIFDDLTGRFGNYFYKSAALVNFAALAVFNLLGENFVAYGILGLAGSYRAVSSG